MIDFCHLHVHTGFSFLDGYGLPNQILAKVKELGHRAIGISDHGNIWSHIPFWIEQKQNFPDIKVIYGCEFYIVENINIKSRKRYHITVFAKNTDGLINLHRLNNFAQFEGFHYKPRITFTELLKHKEGLIVLSGCTGSGVLIQNLHNEEFINNYLSTFKQNFGSDFYIEVSPIKKFRSEIQQMITLGNNFNIKIVSTSDAHYPDKNDYEIEDLMVCIGTKSTYSDVNRLKLLNTLYLFDGAEAESRGKLLYGKDFKQYFENTLEIADKCNAERIISGQKSFPLPENYTDNVSYFMSQIQRGIKFRDLKKKSDWEIYEKRINYEMDLIVSKGFVDYFLVIQDMVLWAKQRMLVGAARGSVAGSLIAYILQITEVDPIPFGLMFERFIDITRQDPPDIDLDFPDEKRYEIIGYLINKYGKNHVCQLGTISYFKSKIALWDTRRVYNLPWNETKELANLTIERSSGDARAQFCLNDTFTLFDRAKEIVKKYPKFKSAIKLEGQIRQTGIHAAGVIVSEEPLINMGGMTRGKSEDEKVLCCDKYGSENLGLLKIDVLGLKQLTIIENILKMINKPFNWIYNIPLDDENTFEIFRKRKYCGIFQFEGDAVQMVCSQVKPDSFINIAEISALARPGALHCGGTTKYIEFRAYEKKFDHKNKKKPYYEHPLLKKLAGDTYGIVIYQEQVLKILTELGNMDWQDAATLRKAMSKSYGVEYFNRFKDKFLAGAKQNNIKKEIAIKIWDNVCTFGSWAFNKSHAVSYGLLSYWSAYLKANYPNEFYVCTLQKESADEIIKKLLREWVESGKEFIPFSFKHSDINFSIKEGKIYGGWKNLKGIGEKQAEQICKFKPFQNSDDLRDAVGKTGLRILKALGELPDGLPKKNNQINLFTNEIEIETWNDIEENFSKQEIIPWADLYPIGKEFGWMYDKYKLTKIKDISENTTNVMMIAKITSLNLRDVFEAGITQNRDLTKIKDPHLKEFLLLHIEDDTGAMVAGMNRYLFPKYKKMIFEDAGIGAIIGFKGKKVPGYMKINIENIKILKSDKNQNE